MQDLTPMSQPSDVFCRVLLKHLFRVSDPDVFLCLSDVFCRVLLKHLFRTENQDNN